MIRNSNKEAPKQGSGLVHLMTALHQNASNIVNSNSQLNGPDQVLHAEENTTTRRNGSVKLRKDDHGLGSEEPVSVPTLLQNVANSFPDVIAFKVKRYDEWATWTYEQYLKEVNLVARGFIQVGLHRHHSVAILSNNSPEWIVSDLGAIFAGGIAVGLNICLSSEEIARICIDCKADIIVVENEAMLKKILLIQHKLPDLRTLVQIQGEPPLSDKRRLHRTHKKVILSWGQLIEIGHNLPEERLQDRLKRVAINQCCTIIYTSGTDDTSKGVMLSHDNLTWCARTSLGYIRAPGFNRMPIPGEEILLSVLPHSSISAQIIDIYYTMCVIGTLCISGDKDLMTHSEAFFDAVYDVQPTVLFAPALIYEKIYHKLRSLKRQMSGLQRIVLDWSSGTLRDKHLSDQNRITATKKLNQLQTSIAKNTVCKKYKEALGFSSRSVFLSRGAPMAREVLRFLAGYDILIHETFGQTENCGLLTANIPKRYCKLGTTGKQVPGVKMKILPSSVETPFTEGLDAETGEIVCSGRNVFMGYLNKERETKDVTYNEGNYLSLGDLGYINHEGFIVILGKQDTFITLATGQVLSPLRMEQLVRLELPCIHQALIIGEKQDYLTALLTLDTVYQAETGNYTSELTEEAQKWFRHSRFNVKTVAEVIEQLDQGLHHVIQAGIDRVNQGTRNTVNTIADWRILYQQFSYQNGELGLNGRLKRPMIVEKHKSCIQAMYVNKNDPGHCSGGGSSSGIADVSVQPHSLTQIREEDETKTSSRNSVDDKEESLEKSDALKEPETKEEASENEYDDREENNLSENENHKTTILIKADEDVESLSGKSHSSSIEEGLNSSLEEEEDAIRKSSAASDKMIKNVSPNILLRTPRNSISEHEKVTRT